MSRAAYWADEPDVDSPDDQIDFLGVITRAELLRQRPPGERPLGPIEWWCQAPRVTRDARGVRSVVTCFGAVVHETDALGRLVTVCQRAGCGHVERVARRVMAEPARTCGRCLKPITGENRGQNERGGPFCVNCRQDRNRRARARERARNEQRQRDGEQAA